MAEEKQQAEHKPAAKVEKPTSVQTLQTKNGLTLVEWQADGRMYRNWIKVEDVSHTSDGAQVVGPEKGVPYGFDFARLVKLSVTPQMIDTELKRVGIWTAEDLRTRTAEARVAIQSAYGVDLASLLNAVRAWEKENNP